MISPSPAPPPRARESGDFGGVKRPETMGKIPPAGGRFFDTAGILPDGWPRRAYRIFQPIVERIFGFDGLWKLHRRVMHPPYDPAVISERVLRELGVGWWIAPAERSALEAVEGPLVLVANHPCGGIDFFALVELMEAVRPGGWMFMANRLITSITGFEERFIPMDPLETGPEAARFNQRGLTAARRHLSQGGLLGLFPAGRVSHRHDRRVEVVADRPWTGHALKLAARTNASIAALHLDAMNRPGFLRLSPDWPRLRALALCRELLHPHTKTISVRLAAIHAPESTQRLAADPRGTQRLRASVYLSADAALPRPKPLDAKDARRIPPVAPASGDPLEEEWRCASIQPLLRHGRFDLLFFRGDAAPRTLLELGRVRETTFRAAGQGVGKERDLNPEDEYYHHLILWDREGQRLAGAYRVGHVPRILDEHGPGGLYLNHVFEVDPGSTGNSVGPLN